MVATASDHAAAPLDDEDDSHAAAASGAAGSRVSQLTPDDRSVVSHLSRMSASLGLVLVQAGWLLRGEAGPPADGSDHPDIPEDIVYSGDSEEHWMNHIPNMDDPDNPSPTAVAALNGQNGNGHAARSTGPAIDFLEDPSREMTLSRRLALFLMRRYAWYNPALKNESEELEEDESPNLQDSNRTLQTSNTGPQDAPPRSVSERPQAYPISHARDESPSLEKAWAYFEHVALPRYMVKPKPDGDRATSCPTRCLHKFQKADKTLDRAEPGECQQPTALYSVLFTPHTQLGDWGLGIGLYFSTLRALTVLTLLAGILNIPNFMYFTSSDYDGNEQADVRGLVKGSAICTDTVWVPCPDCREESFWDGNPFRSSRMANLTGIDGRNVTFALHNACDGATTTQAMVNYGTTIFVCIGILVLNMYLTRMQVAFDEDEQTAQDYSVVISNPPPDATDPEEWRHFFATAFDAHVTALTVAVSNDLLVRSLVERREVLQKIEQLVEPGTALDTLTLAGIAASEERERRWWGNFLATFLPGVPELFGRLAVLTAKIQGLSQQSYPATNIFCTFETESDQRKVLTAFNLGSRDVAKQNTQAVAEKHLFRHEFVLNVGEPDEPNTVRWQDLNETFKERMKQQLLTSLCTCIAIFCIALIIRLVDSTSPAVTAIAIALFNSVFPEVAKFLTNFEAHSSEGGKQRSLYFKIAIFRWVNTAVVITIITPFTDTLKNDNGLVEKIYALFFAEIVTTTLIQLADPMGHIKRHFLAPRQKTQDTMNLQFQGEIVELAERYTNMTKILFLALWYCAIYPGALFMCSFALFVNYFLDRFSLMRTWKRAPSLGSSISEFSRRYFFSISIVCMALVSSYFWAGFPFDNICPTDTLVNRTLVGTFELQLDEGNTTQVTVQEGDPQYQYCLQDFLRYDFSEVSFPFVSMFQREGFEWMTQDQEVITDIHGWSAVCVAGIVLAVIVWNWIYSGLRSLWHGSYEACGDDQGIGFSEVEAISSYIPQVESPVFSYPLLPCNIQGIDTSLLEWSDPDKPHSYYDLTKDAEHLLRGTDVSSKVVFSQIAHWPPKKQKTQK